MVTWLVRCWMRLARPIARAIQRLSMGPLSMEHPLTTRESTSEVPLFSALATADSRSFRMTRAERLGVCLSIAIASSTRLPRTRLATTRILRGEIRTCLQTALASMSKVPGTGAITRTDVDLPRMLVQIQPDFLGESRKVLTDLSRSTRPYFLAGAAGFEGAADFAFRSPE